MYHEISLKNNGIYTKLKYTQIYASIGDSVDALIQWLEDYIGKRRRKIITTIKNNTDITIINKTEITRKQKKEGKQLSGHFKKQTNLTR